MPLFLFCVGIVGAVAPIAAARVGADRRDIDGVRSVGHQALILSLAAVGAGLDAPLERRCDPDRRSASRRDLAELAGRYMHGLQWALAPALLYFAARSILAALDRIGGHR